LLSCSASFVRNSVWSSLSLRCVSKSLAVCGARCNLSHDSWTAKGSVLLIRVSTFEWTIP
jgi:hypothetical protein